LDPEEGDIYKVKIATDDGKVLRVRGYIGFLLLEEPKCGYVNLCSYGLTIAHSTSSLGPSFLLVQRIESCPLTEALAINCSTSGEVDSPPLCWPLVIAFLVAASNYH